MIKIYIYWSDWWFLTCFNITFWMFMCFPFILIIYFSWINSLERRKTKNIHWKRCNKVNIILLYLSTITVWCSCLFSRRLESKSKFLDIKRRYAKNTSLLRSKNIPWRSTLIFSVFCLINGTTGLTQVQKLWSWDPDGSHRRDMKRFEQTTCFGREKQKRTDSRSWSCV